MSCEIDLVVGEDNIILRDGCEIIIIKDDPTILATVNSGPMGPQGPQ